VWAVGDDGEILVTYDGQRWYNINSPTRKNLRDIFVIDSQNIIIVGDDGYIARTWNGGENWHREYSGSSKNLHGITGLYGYYFFAVGDDGECLVKYSVDSYRWHKLHTGTSKNLLSIIGARDFLCLSFQ
jgi:photosystem II stability/assembly factor-like uncharacterized protein